MKHTPGPWGAAARQGDDWESVVYVPGTPNEICQCFHTSMSLGGKENCEANAHLIAAAPELLEALKAINAQACSWHEVHHDNPTTQCDSICALIPQMNAAIRKAEGGAQ